MPRLNGTGPIGGGPMTGRGLGFCGGGFRRGFGRYGLGYSPSQTQVTKEEEKEILQGELSYLEAELKAVKARLAEFKEKK